MSVNRGKQFEETVRKSLANVGGTSIVRLPDPVQGYLGYRNICDFIVYHYPHQYFIECKTIHGNTFPYSNITKNQLDGMYKMAQYSGVVAGVLVWFVDHDVTKFLPIDFIKYDMNTHKSVRFDYENNSVGGKWHIITVHGKKKRVLFEYDFYRFFKEVSREQREYL